MSEANSTRPALGRLVLSHAAQRDRSRWEKQRFYGLAANHSLLAKKENHKSSTDF